ncbi:hypothetical protein [Paractinoplanes durhamensis]|uniref:Phage tail protein n=1 Tax=Paractinoplanes durhamensis TaxID=113563 RepID=A0ABQ3ZE20_9ACTN|nr:hypothetical protein [Actinoplanes durhamensis]GIE07784.1 hypothetical protein Adu01nite_91340 [Actinoplanes durhamensis]
MTRVNVHKRYLFVDETGPGRNGPDLDAESPWAGRIGSTIIEATLHWTAVKLSDQTTEIRRERGMPPVLELHAALRLDFDAGPVWFVAAMPWPPTMPEATITGEEIMVVCTAERGNPQQ